MAELQSSPYVFHRCPHPDEPTGLEVSIDADTKLILCEHCSEVVRNAVASEILQKFLEREVKFAFQSALIEQSNPFHRRW